jgi:hypothetical protein
VPDLPRDLTGFRQLADRLRHPWRIDADNLDKLPTGACIVAVNRVSPFDHLNVAASLGREATVVFEPDSGRHLVPGIRHTRWLADPDSGNSPAAVLDRGEILIVFPEGATDGDGTLHKGHAQFAALALSTGVPIVPAALIPLSVNDLLPELRYRLRIGEPIETGRFAEAQLSSNVLDGFMLRGLTDLVMTRIGQLAGRRYVDSYTGTAKKVRIPGEPVKISEWRDQRAERRAAEEQRRASEAELARLLDEQDAAIIDEAVEAARQQAERAALAEQRARAQRRRTNKQPPDSDE